ncbi:hypothetical protein [Peptostreptococcus equinus]|uniref:AraC family transcriptional regulator n=1 Tax=Peptostreptococcus equinus TaxID=3003601 RepID=A0ABY7JS11_9FIRM|nr:hypothetical protein [Peptostreptococcus sp. CBA3647]WAW15286.1 hypothetical protein O0R46_02205 [Peptostreptococcus sp. CBA3647]
MTEVDILASTYSDSMNVYRYEEKENPFSHITDMGEVLKHSNILCELDYGQSGISYALAGETDGLNSDYTVFCRPEIDVIEGDKLVITHLGREYTCTAGLPFKWSSHLEIPVTMKKRV